MSPKRSSTKVIEMKMGDIQNIEYTEISLNRRFIRPICPRSLQPSFDTRWMLRDKIITRLYFTNFTQTLHSRFKNLQGENKIPAEQVAQGLSNPVTLPLAEQRRTVLKSKVKTFKVLPVSVDDISSTETKVFPPKHLPITAKPKSNYKLVNSKPKITQKFSTKRNSRGLKKKLDDELDEYMSFRKSKSLKPEPVDS